MDEAFAKLMTELVAWTATTLDSQPVPAPRRSPPAAAPEAAPQEAPAAALPDQPTP